MKYSVLLLCLCAVLVLLSISDSLFHPVEATITPSVVAAVDVSTATATNFQRKLINASNLMWCFYQSNANLSYKTSVDGKTWSAVTHIRALTTGGAFSVCYYGTYFHYAIGLESYLGWDAVYRSGTLNPGDTTTWRAAEPEPSKSP